MIQIQIKYDYPEEKELAESYQNAILEERLNPSVPVVVIKRR